MASVSFFPAGSQIDQDSIKDIQLSVGDKFSATFELDTEGLDANLQLLDLRVDQDIVEIDLQAVRTDADVTAFPNLVFGGSPQGDDIFSAIFERNGPPGAVPNTTQVIFEGEITGLSDLRNDGKPDLGLTVVKAIDADGKDVTHLFEPSSQAVDIQAFPVARVSVDRTLPLSEANADSGTFIIELNEPAPVGGLLVNFDPVDSDGIPGDVVPSTVNGTLQIGESGSPSGILIDEGATEARITITAVPDDIPEGEEISGLDILPGDGYTIDPSNNSSLFVVTDLPIVTFSVDRTVISEDGEPQLYTLELSEPAPDGGLTVKLQLDDPDNDLSDGGFPQEFFNNITDSDFVVENGNAIVKFTILPGARSANFGFIAGEDNKVEGDEEFTLTLLEDESYSIDLASVGISTTITEKEIINGTDAGEKLFGTDTAELIIGFQGDDTIFGNGGEDILIGDGGDDLIYGASQADTILAGQGDDTIFGNGGEDTLIGDGGDDLIYGASQADTILAGQGDDTIFGNGGEDTLIGDGGDDLIYGASQANIILAGQGDDTIFGNGGEDTLIGNGGDDLIYGASQADTILAGQGDDIIFGNGGGDFINSGSGLDIVWLGTGQATVVLESGESFDTVNNFQLGLTNLQVESTDNLSFVDSVDGTQIFQGDDLLGVVSWQFANTFEDNQGSIFVI